MSTFLLDQGLPRQAAELLRSGGIDAMHTAEIGASTLEDDAIVELALLKAEATAALVRKVLAHCADDLDAGAIVSVQPGRLRVRRLPVLR